MGWRDTRAAIAVARRKDPAADTTALYQQMKVEHLAAKIEETLGAAPPLTPAQRRLLRNALHSSQDRTDVA